MPTNPFEPPREVNGPERKRKVGVAFWSWALITVITWPPIGAALGLLVFVALAFFLAVTGLAWHVSIGSGLGWMLGGMILVSVMALIRIACLPCPWT
jgi:hypothetical protein